MPKCEESAIKKVKNSLAYFLDFMEGGPPRRTPALQKMCKVNFRGVCALEARAKHEHSLIALRKTMVNKLNVDSAEKPRGQIAAKPG